MAIPSQRPKLLTPDLERFIEQVHVRSAAEAERTRATARRVEGLKSSPGGEAFERFTATRTSQATKRLYQCHIADFLLWLARNTRFEDPLDVTPETLSAYTDAVYQTVVRRTGKPTAIRTRQERIRTIRATYQYCVDEELLGRSPARHVRITGRAEPNRTFLTEAQAHALIKACSGPTLVDLRDRSLVVLLLHTGLRAAEAAGLRWRDLALETNPRVTVEGKGRVIRTVPLSDTARRCLHEWKAVSPGNASPQMPVWIRVNHRLSGEASRNLRSGDWTPTHSAIGTQSVRRIVVNRARKAGLPRTTPHTLRRTYATKLRSVGITLDTIARYLGHASIVTTAAYFNPVDEAAVERVRELEY